MNELLKYNKHHIFLGNFPEWNSYYSDVSAEYDEFVVIVQTIYDGISLETSSMKEFCAKIDEFPEIADLLRKMRVDSQKSASQYLSTLQHKSLGFTKPFKAFLSNKESIKTTCEKFIKDQ